MTDLHRQQTPPPPPPGAQATPQSTGTSPVRLVMLAAVVAFLGIAGGWPLLVVVLGVVFMIFLHEVGHYVTARLGGMQVTEFFIGFGPQICSFRRGETEYGIKALPAGAYVRITGMNNLDEVDPAVEDRTYRAQSYPRRLAVSLAGSAMHFAQALVLLFLLHAFVGVPSNEDVTTADRWQVGAVTDGSAADAAGIQEGDQILTLDGASLENFEEMRTVIAASAGQTVVLGLERDGQPLVLTVTVGERELDDGTTGGFLGVGPRPIAETVGPLAAAGRSARDFGTGVSETIGFLTSFFTPSGIAGYADDLADTTRPEPAPGATPPSDETSTDESDEGRLISIVGAVRIGADLTERGIVGFLAFFVGINITVGVFNLIPLLPLDGGHVAIATYERIREIGRRGRRYHADVARLLPVAYAVIMVLVVIGVTSLYLDLIDPVSL